MKRSRVRVDRSHNGQVSEFAELNHFRDPQKAGDMPDLYGTNEEPETLEGHDTVCQLDTAGVRQREFAGADPSGDAQRTNDGTESC